MGTLREPGCLNAYLFRCSSNVPPVGAIMRLAFRGAFRVGPDFRYQLDLLARAEYTTTPPYTLTFHIRRDARWSDGAPITARDFVFTHKAIRSVRKEMWEPDAAAWSIVRSTRAVDAKTVKVVLRGRFASWRGLFPHVLPAHVFQGEDFSKIWLERLHDPKTGRPIGSGPFLVAAWERGDSVTFVRNARYWKRPAYLDRLVLRFCRQCGAAGAEQLELLRDGEIDLIRSIQLTGEQVRELRGLPGVRVLARPGASWEHIDIRMGLGDIPPSSGSSCAARSRTGSIASRSPERCTGRSTPATRRTTVRSFSAARPSISRTGVRTAFVPRSPGGCSSRTAVDEDRTASTSAREGASRCGWRHSPETPAGSRRSRESSAS